MSKLAHLREFTAHRNKFKGSIPVDIGECRELTLLSLHHNRLTGFLPESITQCLKLKQLLLVKNKLIGSSVPASLYTDTDMVATPRSGITLKCQVFPSKSADSDSETEESPLVVALQTQEEDTDQYAEYEQSNGDGGASNYIGYAGEYVDDYDQYDGVQIGLMGEVATYEDAYTDGYGADSGTNEITELDYYQEEGASQAVTLTQEDATGYYDELGNWVEGYYDEEGNWIETQPDTEWSGYGGGEATGYDYDQAYYD